MITLLYIFVNLEIGGAEEHLRTVVNNLDSSHFRPVICCIREKGKIGREIEDSGFRVISLGRHSKTWDPAIVWDLTRIIREEKIDLVHCHLFHSNMYGRIAALISGIPSVITEHNVYLKYKFKRRLINRLLSRITGQIIAVSEMVKNHIIPRDHLAPSSVTVVYNGIDVKRIISGIDREAAKKRLGLQKEKFVVGSLARLTEQKGHIYLVKTASRLKALIPDLAIVITGTGPLEASLKQAVKDEGLEHIFLFLGARRDVPEILRAFDVFVMPSLWEGFPMALLEAMACSLPVVATPVGGIREVLTDRINGIIIEPRDAVALTNAVHELYSNDKLRTELGHSAGETVRERFTARGMINSLELIYRNLCKV